MRRKWRKAKPKEEPKKFVSNREIRVPEVFLIGEEGQQYGEMSTPKAMALSSIIGLSNSRCFKLSFLESLSNSCLKLPGRITAAAVTGPDKHPLPASSVPHSNLSAIILCLNI